MTLFGNGEELRDHIFIGDVAELVFNVVKNKICGELNLVSGKTHSFFEIANIVYKSLEKDPNIKHLERVGPMPHNGYRAFDNQSILNLFPNFRFSCIEEEISNIMRVPAK